jgi:hypothetical protein
VRGQGTNMGSNFFAIFLPKDQSNPPLFGDPTLNELMVCLFEGGGLQLVLVDFHIREGDTERVSRHARTRIYS